MVLGNDQIHIPVKWDTRSIYFGMANIIECFYSIKLCRIFTIILHIESNNNTNNNIVVRARIKQKKNMINDI